MSSDIFFSLFSEANIHIIRATTIYFIISTKGINLKKKLRKIAYDRPLSHSNCV